MPAVTETDGVDHGPHGPTLGGWPWPSSARPIRLVFQAPAPAPAGVGGHVLDTGCAGGKALNCRRERHNAVLGRWAQGGPQGPEGCGATPRYESRVWFVCPARWPAARGRQPRRLPRRPRRASAPVSPGGRSASLASVAGCGGTRRSRRSPARVAGDPSPAEVRTARIRRRPRVFGAADPRRRPRRLPPAMTVAAHGSEPRGGPPSARPSRRRDSPGAGVRAGGSGRTRRRASKRNGGPPAGPRRRAV